MLDMAGIDVPAEHQGIALAPWCRGVRNDAPRAFALVTNGGEGPHYDPWPELRTLVTDRWKLQYYVNEGLIELDDLKDDPSELQPGDPGDQSELVLSLIEKLVDAGSAASVWGSHTGRW